jgi:hypothetical protein
MAFSLIEFTDNFITRETLKFERQPHLYPSESSSIWLDEGEVRRVAGTCLRSTYFRYTGTAKPKKKEVHSEWIFSLGKAVEQILIEYYKQAGIWVANNIEFFWPEYNIKGEIDCILKDPETGEKCIWEGKSFYGYNTTKDLCGNSKIVGKPKTQNLFQVSLYLYKFRDLFPYAKLIYYARDSAKRAEFTITLQDEGPNQTRIFVNGIPDQRFYIQNILNRYKEAMQYIEMHQIPPRDYELVWDTDRIEEAKARGEISKSAYEDWQKGKDTIGDWTCRYCNYNAVCYNKTGKVILP